VREPWAPRDPEDVIAAYETGITVVEIASRAGISRFTVRCFLLRHGVVLRGRDIPRARHMKCECGRMLRSVQVPPYGCIRCTSGVAPDRGMAGKVR
jgi:hypothetical protein